EARCAFVILLMATYYMTEALPLAVTALMPVFAFPLLGIISTDAICRFYMRGTAMMFFGGLSVAIAVEHCNLHKRIALFVILKVGQSPTLIMIGFMLTTMFISMWISNTAAGAMMIPILDAILQELFKNDKAHNELNKSSEDFIELKFSKKTLSKTELIENSPNLNMLIRSLHHSPRAESFKPERKEEVNNNEERLSPPDKESQALSTMLFLATAYSANIGGTAFPTGTGPNLVFWGLFQNSFSGNTGLNFVSWMLFNIPGMFLCMLCTWALLQIHFMGIGKWRKFPKCSEEKKERIRNLVQHHYDSLGPITFHEICVTVLFSTLVLLWVFRAPGKVGNATPAIFIVFLLFIIPSKLPWKDTSAGPIPSCLTWEVVHKKVPWGLILLVGGGFAMAEGASASGLSTWLQAQLQVLEILPKQAIVFLVCFITTFLTEIITNITAASVLLPVLKDMAIGLGIHPLYLMLPGTVCCSYAFMLPVSNPPNAIAFNASTMKTTDMMKVGFFLNIICIVIMTILINTLGVEIFDLKTFPEWAGNATVNASSLIEPLANDTLI
ncbi:Solute carrier family 13 member 2, partial [Armadillidium vulgare]